jgi:hypothetical protein
VCFNFKNVTHRSKVLSQQRFHFSLNITFSYIKSINVVQKFSIYFFAKSNYNSLHNNSAVQLFLQKRKEKLKKLLPLKILILKELLIILYIINSEYTILIADY